MFVDFILGFEKSFLTIYLLVFYGLHMKVSKYQTPVNFDFRKKHFVFELRLAFPPGSQRFIIRPITIRKVYFFKSTICL